MRVGCRIFAALLPALLLLLTLTSCSDPATSFDPENALANEVFGENALEQVQALVGFGPRPAGSEALEESRIYLIEFLSMLGWETERQIFEDQTPTGKMEFTNLRARFGEGRWNQRVSGLICTHYDTKLSTRSEYVGANGGASGAGLLVELARVLATRPELAKEVELVFLDGREAFGANITANDGLYGSKHYAKEWLLNPKRIPDWGLVLDRVGSRSLNLRAGVRIPGSSLRDLTKVKEEGYSIDVEEMQKEIQKLSRELLSAAEDLDARNMVGVSPDYLIDDHIPLNIVAGIPTIALIDADYSFQHTPGDTMEKLSAESLELSGRVTLQLVEKYLVE